MGLFSKKPPCPICGGKISWLLPWKIEGKYICTTCYNKIDMEADKAIHLTMQGFKEYLAFYDQNQLMRDQFTIFEGIDFGHWDTKIIFDYQHKMFCMSKNLDKTIFEGKQLKSFSIKEDNTPLFEGTAEGVKSYVSTVPDRALALAPQVIHYMMKRHLTRTLDKKEDGKEKKTTPMQYFDVPEPFQRFKMELHFDHPYWTVIKCDMDGPRFSNDSPDVKDYICSYEHSIQEIEKLVVALQTVAFPDAPEQYISFGVEEIRAVHRTIADTQREKHSIAKNSFLMHIIMI